LEHGTAAVPSLWFLELSNALVVGERRKRLEEADTADALRLLSRLPLTIDDRVGFPLAADLLDLARGSGLSA
jgi:hypothetical protein